MTMVFSNSFGGGYNPLYGRDFKPINNKLDASPPKFDNCRKICVSELSSKYNVNFKGLYDKKLDDFCGKLENRIKEMLAPQSSETAKNALTSEYIDLINNEFKENDIGSIYSSGISANSMLNYLAVKKQLQLKGLNTAFIIDKMSLDFIKNKGIKDFYRDVLSLNIKFYCLDTDEKETKALIDEFNSLTNNLFKIKKIQKSENSPHGKYPDTEKLSKIIKTFAQKKFSHNYALEHKFIDVITHYMDNSFLAFSYASLEEKMKEQYKNIENYLASQGKTMEDALYVIPEKDKSYDLINYLYAKANNIQSSKFITPKDIKDGFDGNKAYIILDDACASGNSALNNITEMKKYTDNIITAPIIGYNSADIKMKNTEKNNKIRIKYLPLLKYKDLGAFNYLNQPSFISQQRKDEAQAAINEFKNFSLEDAAFILKHTKCGIGGNHAFINFPYMIPDNSSELNAYIGGYFLNNDNPEANKAVFGNSEGNIRRVNQTEYYIMKNTIDAPEFL